MVVLFSKSFTFVIKHEIAAFQSDNTLKIFALSCTFLQSEREKQAGRQRIREREREREREIQRERLNAVKHLENYLSARFIDQVTTSRQQKSTEGLKYETKAS